MSDSTPITIGLDLGDRTSALCVLDKDGDVIERASVRTSRKAIGAYFRLRQAARVVMEVGTHSPWVSELLGAIGHEVIVANPRRVKLISENNQKSDETDAELLARLGRVDPKLLAPVTHREEKTRRDLVPIRARDVLVRSRAMLVTSIRGQIKSQGHRLSSCSAASFHKRAKEQLPDELLTLLRPMLDCIEKLTHEIRYYDKQIERLAREKYPETEPLMQITGVGALTALTFVLTLEDPHRFERARDVGPYLGLTPARKNSGMKAPELGITKSGDEYLRKLLVQSGQYILGPFGADSALRQWGHQLAARGGKAAKRKAVVAVARKLATIMYCLWASGEDYQPFPREQRSRPKRRPQSVDTGKGMNSTKGSSRPSSDKAVKEAA